MSGATSAGGEVPHEAPRWALEAWGARHVVGSRALITPFATITHGMNSSGDGPAGTVAEITGPVLAIPPGSDCLTTARQSAWMRSVVLMLAAPEMLAELRRCADSLEAASRALLQHDPDLAREAQRQMHRARGTVTRATHDVLTGPPVAVGRQA